MTVTDTRTDRDACTLTITARFERSVERVWELWSDPRQLERWWGPPTYPATVVDHVLEPGGTVTYFMTGPEGDRHYGWWRITTVEAPTYLEFVDGFGDENGRPSPDMPTTNVAVRFRAESAGVTTMTILSTFPSVEAMDQMVAMGMVEGMTEALGQIDALLAV